MNNIKKARKAKGLTAEQLAKQLGFVKGTISNYEQGYRQPDPITLKRMAELLDCSVDYLVGNEEGITISRTEYQNLKEAQRQFELAYTNFEKAFKQIEKRIKMS